MAGFSNSSESNVLKLVFQNVDWANVGDATGLRGSSTAGSFYISLHTGDPGEGGSQTTSEAAYTGYGRVAVARSTGAWTVSGTAPTEVTNAAEIAFGESSTSETETHFVVGRAAAGAGEIIAFGSLTASLAVSSGVTPRFAAGALDVTLD